MCLAHRLAPPDLLLGAHVHRFAWALPHLLLTGPGAAEAVTRAAALLTAEPPEDVEVLSFAHTDVPGRFAERCMLLERLVGESSVFRTPHGPVQGVRIPFRAVEAARRRVDPRDLDADDPRWPRYTFLTVPELADLTGARRRDLALLLTRGRVPGFFVVAGTELVPDSRVAENCSHVAARDALLG